MKWWVSALVVLAASRPALAQPVLEPHRFEPTFENGSVGSWSSYPPAQDTAYDPTIGVRPLAGEPGTSDRGNRALYRELTPHYANDIELGVRKRLDLVVDASSHLRFRAYVREANGMDGVKVRFAFADGTDRSSTVVVRQTRRWVEADVAFGEHLDAGEQKHLVAIAFVALCPNADTDSLHLSLVIDGTRYIINRNPGSVMRDGTLTTDAAVYARDGERQWILRGSRTSTGDGRPVATEVPVSLILDGTSRVLFSTPSATRLTLGVAERPRVVVVNGEEVSEWSFDAGTGLSVALPEGSGSIELRR